MSNNVIQPSFAAGELSPTLYARVDLAAYHVGVALAENFYVDYRGGLSNRPGTKFVARGWISSTAIRLIPFAFSTIQTYMLEFGDLYMRVIKDGALVLEPSVNLSAITRANPGLFTTTTNHGFVNGDEVYFASVGGMTQMNQVFGVVQNATLNTFSLNNLEGVLINTTSYTAFTSGGTVSRVVRVTTPYAAADLALLKFTQSADTMTLTHPSYAIRELTRTTHYTWTLSTVTIGTTATAPTGLTATPNAAGAANFAYKVTAVDANGQESQGSTRADATSAVAIMNTAGQIALAWNAVTGADHYNVYKAQPTAAPAATALPAGANLGFMGSFTTNAAVDGNITPDFSITPPLGTNPFSGTNYPGVAAYYQQRLVFAASTSLPQTLWMSQPGAFHNFDVRNPVVADDAITATLVSKQVNAIKYMIGMPGGLICLTSGNAFQVSGGTQNEAVSPSNIVSVPQTYNGCADVDPVIVNADIVYVQSKGTVVRDLEFNFYTNIYTGTDISLLSSHLFQNITILQSGYQEEPTKIIWYVTSKGDMLALTYLKEEKIKGWSHHHTLGTFESVATIQEGTTNAVYVVVRRYLQGRWLRMIERMATRTFPYGVEDAWFLDCALSNTLTYPAAGLTADVSTGAVTFTADAAVFSSGDVGSILRMDGGIATISHFTSSTVLTGTWTRDAQDILNQDADAYPGVTVTEMPLPATSGNWSLTAPFTTFSGLDHLEGQTVSILGDGSVFPQQTVTGGLVTVAHAVSKIVVGLPYVGKVQTLYLDTGEPTIQGKRKQIPAVTIRVADTRGLKAGPDFDHLTEYKMRSTQQMGQPIALQTGDQRLLVDSKFQEEGQLAFEQPYPLPATILGIVPEVVIGDTK